MKTNRKKKQNTDSGLSLSHAPYQYHGCTFLQIITGTQSQGKTWRSGIHLHSYWFVLPLLSFFFKSKMEFQWAKKKQSRNRSGNKTLEQASRGDRYGCCVVIMSLSAHLLWLPSCLQRGPWGQNLCAFTCVWKDVYERVCRSVSEDNSTAFMTCGERVLHCLVWILKHLLNEFGLNQN